jgi:hypothetical protein
VKRKPFTGIFYWTDTEGIPMEFVVDALQRRGMDVQAHLRLYVLHALKAGWTLPKIASELREAVAFGVPVPESLLSIDQPRRTEVPK